MKKSLLALAVLGAFTGVASAQSSVTLYGTVDLNGRYVDADGQDRRLTLSQDGINSSQLGFRGVEDLGGGLKAGFNLLAGVNADTGTTNSKFFNRRSTVSLFSNFGEVRLGRDYTPTFWNLTIFDAFGTNGIGSSLNVRNGYGGTRQDNTIGYFLPGNLGGFYGQAQYYMGEQLSNTGAADKDGNGFGARFGFANGPFDVALALSRTKYATTATLGDVQQNNIGGQWNFGVAKLQAQYEWDKVDSTVAVKGKGYLVGALVPVGAGEIRAAYSRYKTDQAGDPTSKKLALGYVHNLSKRTALYVTAARVSNNGGAAQSLNGSLTAVNGNSTGYDFGLRHSF